MVFRISLPATTAWVCCGDISSASIGIPVLWVRVWDWPDLLCVCVRYCQLDFQLAIRRLGVNKVDPYRVMGSDGRDTTGVSWAGSA